MVTIKDIAKLANVSHTTVSRALNGSPYIKEHTKQKILELASQLNYTPNVNAKSLAMQKSHTIGLFFTSITNGTSHSFFSDTIKGVNRTISEEYNLFVRAIDDLKSFETITPMRYDGIILMSQSDSDNSFIYHIREKNIPLVVLNRDIDDRSITNILSNDKEGSRQAVDCLIANGHRDIAIIEGKEGFRSTSQRKEGYLTSLIDHSIPIKHEYSVKGRYDMESGSQAMEKLLALQSPPTAVFCSNDDMAIGAMNAIFAKGLNVPEDISVIGFDDIGISQYMTPRLSTVKRPVENISILGAEKILALIADPDTAAEKIYENTEVMIRDSIKNLT
ncbi:LacI family DNA-binding transcriptional regulator [Bacillus velezensis]|uniref:LacI family DNA-binding transcriptional regulator n=1 Tax=Bacillus TaxID=1386 RepID=UPI0005B62712|nr:MULTISPECIES: LacI family DNA-binding transcriptional regulator [Bacillus]MBL3612913.1 LacI family DNA-binding transcriptional regulator [Bacillus sp. RHFS18]AWK45756.1 LacI family transcriptional regulator [Bacillus velezensis]KAF6545294.1 LacI family DNA-binding transcriptional regulator [Bacillus sp. EKM206B]KAF6551223.1 LacI family DNA-binding transcriptional regulator [Bacillus sp. EKM207B]KAF6557483.1 LacI family DNA-binding transcriptional regulator [Bacillus sp. EKM203B]